MARPDLTGIDLSGIDRRELLALLIDAALEAELHTQGGAERAAHFAAEFYSPDQPRNPAGQSGGGRWASAQGSGLAHAYARQKVKEALSTGKPYTDEHVKDLADHLGRLTVAQLHALKAEHGLKASGRNKAALIAKLAERFHGARDKDVDEHGKPGSKTYADLKAQAVQAAQRPGWINPRIAVNDWSGSGRVALVDHPASGHSLRINQAGTIDVQHTRTGQPATSIKELHGHAGKSLADMQAHVEGAHERAGREAIQGLAGQTPGKARQPESVAGKVAAKPVAMKSAAQVTTPSASPKATDAPHLAHLETKLVAAKAEEKKTGDAWNHAMGHNLGPAAEKVAREAYGKAKSDRVALEQRVTDMRTAAYLAREQAAAGPQKGEGQQKIDKLQKDIGQQERKIQSSAATAQANMGGGKAGVIGWQKGDRSELARLRGELQAAKGGPAAMPGAVQKAAPHPSGLPHEVVAQHQATYKGATVDNSAAEEVKGFPKALETLRSWPTAKLHEEARQATRDSANAMFGDNAQKLLVLISKVIGERHAIERVKGKAAAAKEDLFASHKVGTGAAGKAAKFSTGNRPRSRTLDFAALTAGAAESTAAYAESRNGVNRRAGIAMPRAVAV